MKRFIKKCYRIPSAILLMSVVSCASALPEKPVTGLFHITDIKNQHLSTDNNTTKGTSPNGVSEARAKQVLMDYKTQLNITSDSDLQLMKSTTDSFGGQHFRFARTYSNIALDKMEVLVHFNAQGDVHHINGLSQSLSDSLKRSVDRKLNSGQLNATEEQITQKVAIDLKATVDKITVHSAQAKIISQGPYVVWQVDVTDSTLSGRYIYLLTDDKSPSILSKKINIKN